MTAEGKNGALQNSMVGWALVWIVAPLAVAGMGFDISGGPSTVGLLGFPLIMAGLFVAFRSSLRLANHRLNGEPL